MDHRARTHVCMHAYLMYIWVCTAYLHTHVCVVIHRYLLSPAAVYMPLFADFK